MPVEKNGHYLVHQLLARHLQAGVEKQMDLSVIADHADERARGQLRIHSVKCARADAAPDIAGHHVVELHHLPLEEQSGQLVAFESAEEQQPRVAGVLVEVVQNQIGQFGQKRAVVIALQMPV